MSYPSIEYQADDQSQLTYSSDDSGSYSDAYFTRGETVVGWALPTSPIQQHHQPCFYGALDTEPHFQGGSILPGNSYTRMFISGSILEDDAHMMDEPTEQNVRYKARPFSALHSLARDQRKLIRRRQKEQEQRENLVRQVRGKQQPEEWHDTLWLVLFTLQLSVVIFCAFYFGLNASIMTTSTASSSMTSSNAVVPSSDDALLKSFFTDDTKKHHHESFRIDYTTVLEIVSITGLYAGLLATLTFGFMLILAQSLIQTSLMFTMVVAMAWAVFGLAIQPYGIISILGFCALASTLTYTLWIWERIPFAAVNLQTALCAFCGSSDVMLMGMGMLVVASLWCLLWSMAFIGVVDNMDNWFEPDSGLGFLIYITMIFSFCWTNVVITTIVKVTVASAVGSWWYEPDESSSCCTMNLWRPLLRSISTSLGSICYGSLVMVPAQVIRRLANLCCLSGDNYFKNCNRWAYSYIGLYGYNFNEAGFRARQLFEAREWTSIVKENLVYNVLWMTSVAIAGSTGTLGVLVEKVDGYEFTTFHKPIITAFVIGTTFGFVLSHVLLLGVIDSAMNTVLVCFAAAPFEFHKNHPTLSQEMRDAWAQQVWEHAL